MASEREIEEKIAYAIANRKSLPYEELKRIYSEIAEYISSLPESERGNFYWESGMECLTMIFEGAKQ